LDAFVLGKQKGRTHRDQLRNIADTIGAHADFDSREVSDALAKSSSAIWMRSKLILLKFQKFLFG
jgi:hypothetical protein